MLIRNNDYLVYYFSSQYIPLVIIIFICESIWFSSFFSLVFPSFSSLFKFHFEKHRIAYFPFFLFFSFFFLRLSLVIRNLFISFSLWKCLYFNLLFKFVYIIFNYRNLYILIFHLNSYIVLYRNLIGTMIRFEKW